MWENKEESMPRKRLLTAVQVIWLMERKIMLLVGMNCKTHVMARILQQENEHRD
jgi:hypothetical protein